ncbi:MULTISPECIES: (5-formylfuran-3-yl)methyl phosphate synthase [unclassified Caballeronia]|uniref:(5-formylfuran-3-yl)methyl phosphate synthase n=1 Tax=unclassified Caballeronia TaxID=2646786 RepID=UPI002854BC42|nr:MULTISPECIES: (5-formylfuran-3-yl)methyl phosphate synthase [unclassified Caballeronia]MDR5739976.1 (5-formylfuran-3-yl)methyl phosphate synthase [Caballeronia sp. LZ016]MDR5807367.1 (5-formylfuran-3-yl)methyl phosphate synthase [Caballeronia sp. LZ019]
MTALLASVRSADEAFDAVHAGAELIDLKEPHAGALGGVALKDIAFIVRALRARYAVRPISATIGDLPNDALDEMTHRVLDVAATGVDYVKVGVAPGEHAADCLRHLAGLPAAVVPVLLSDEGVDRELAALAAQLGFVGIVFDTANKDGRTLFDCVDMAALSDCMAQARSRGAMTALAGSLGWSDLEKIRALAPDIAGFRGALCDERDGRTGRLDPSRVQRWARALHGERVAVHA